MKDLWYNIILWLEDLFGTISMKLNDYRKTLELDLYS